MPEMSQKRGAVLDAVGNAIGKGLQFLATHQLPSGQFPIQTTFHYKPDSPVEEDASPFATSHVLYSLSFFEGADIESMVNPALCYLKREMTRTGLWRYWNRDAIWDGRRIINFIPADLDDTASHSWLLRHYGIRYPDNRALLVHNRDRQGRFYTWFVPRLKATLDLHYWLAALREITLERMLLFWRTTEADYNDIDAVVNANVILYLGRNSTTLPVIQWLAQVVEKGTELDNDKWYRDLFTFHYALSRCHYAGISGFEHLKSLVITRLNEEQKQDGSFGTEPMHTALALNTLINYKVDISSPSLRTALTRMMDNQALDGGWPSAPYYYGGPKKYVSWGSRELTTALCLEALIRSQTHNPRA
jgi:hypothetical protein